MRILHVITSLRTGGAEKLMVDLLPRLAARGHEVELLCFSGERTVFWEELERRGIRIHSLVEGGCNVYSPATAWRVVRFLKRGGYDIVHSHNTAAQLWVALAGALGCRSRLLTTEHSTNNRRRGKAWLRGADRWMYGRYEQIVAISDDAVEELRKWLPLYESRYRVVVNGIDYARFASAEPSGELGELCGGRKVALMVAGFKPPKDQPTLIRAVAEAGDGWAACFAGVGELEASCRALARELGVEERVKFLGMRTDVAELMRGADAVVLASHYEGLSLSSLEGMASGRPFVASDVKGLRDIVGGAGLLFADGDSSELARILLRLGREPELCTETGRRGQERAARYGIEETAAGYDGLYSLRENDK